MDIPHDMPPHGILEELEPGIRRIIAPNPSPMTYWGTNTFVLGEGNVTVIDPGPMVESHAQALLAGLQPGERVAHILVTHAHVDHSPLARPLSDATGADVYAFGPAEAGRSEVMAHLVAQGMTSGGEGIDWEFFPDEIIADGDRLDLDGVRVEAIWTPGHLSNHLSFAMGDAVFVGDHVMAWASSLVSPPDGDLTAFMESCRKLAARLDRIHYPAHGPAITAPRDRLDWLIDHRLAREGAILAALEHSETLPEITRAVYTDTPPELLPAAERNVFAHLIDLASHGRITATPKLTTNAAFHLKPRTNPT
ncbi:MBL fold metallo-hydrolase [Maritimibacter sp. DP1N21-5]|uniref:MBL fold metallo-hydrolase n=1 Tax=Maritimibacter sp. DP1N21-5 TaxID=2836867 RepID=UPI001C43F0D6|nr:MBL fold metallo-hydrolase [Maritimibacter sp. DP1N21-5]MBV7409641.1 MBL fold metallo-hydrolase [Maritimibacter sp. DP1N21-5]